VSPPKRVAELLWPHARIGEAVVALARRSGLIAAAAPAARNPPSGDEAALDRWLSAAGAQLGVEVEPVVATNREAEGALGSLFPALVQIGDRVLLVLGRRGRALVCLGPDGDPATVARRDVALALQSEHAGPHLEKITSLMAKSALPEPAQRRAGAAMLAEFLAQTKVLRGWLLRLPPAASFFRQVRGAGLLRLGAVLVAAHVLQYVMFLVAWWAISRAVLRGSVATGWLWGWALILLALVPLMMVSTWCQGKLAVGFGMLLRRRLLAGALELPAAMINREGVGGLLGHTIEAGAVERLALGGGFLATLSLLELALATPVLVAGAGGWGHAVLLLGWLLVAAVLAARLARARFRWTDQRLTLTGMTVERIVGHRTRLAQEVPERWHDGEDEALAGYLDRSTELDRRSLALLVVVPRGWLLLGMAALAPAFIRGADVAALGTAIGGVVFAWLSLTRLGGGLDQLATAYVAWLRVAPLFHAAAGKLPAQFHSARPTHRPTAPEYVVSAPTTAREPVLEAIDLTFRHGNRAVDVLHGCDLVVRRGDRILLQGSSGSGKSTFASLLTGMQPPRSGLLLARGLDMSCLGELGWKSRVSAAPQFHENHVLSETFAFNLLMGRGWPPRPEDVGEATKVCEELGLGPLLERMPGGLFQMVGESGWQLSHGEQSRLFIARALLQRCDVIILDESLAALDPENMATTLRCMRARAPSLIVIAHP
jgi:ATP-binding cassette, subfamily B, bacterial